MPVVPTYESQVTLRPHDAGTLNPIDTTKMLPSTAPDFSKLSAAAMAFQKKIDTSRVLEAKNAAMQYISDATYGENGYLKLQGKAATEADKEGRGLVQRNLEGLNTYMDTWQKDNNLTASQRQMLSKEMMGLRLQFQNGIGAHVLQEQKRYELGEYQANVKLGLSNAAKGFKSEASLAGTVVNLDKTVDDALTMGLITEAEAKLQKESIKSGVYTNAIMASLVDMGTDPKGGYERAKVYYKRYGKYIKDDAAIELQGKLNQAGLVAAQNEIVRQVTNTYGTGSNTGVDVASSVISNGKKGGTQCVALGLAFDAVKYPGQLSADGTVAVRGKGGYGVSGLSEEVARRTFNENPDKFRQFGTKFDAEKFKSDERFNMLIGMEHFSKCFNAHRDSLEEAVAAYRWGEAVLMDAKEQAGEKGNWMDYLPKTHGGKEALLNVVKTARDKQNGVQVDGKGNEIDPLSTEYLKAFATPLSRDAQITIVDNVGGDLVRNNPLAREQLIHTANAQQALLCEAKRAQYTNAVLSGMRLIEEKGASLGAACLTQEVLQALPPASQQALIRLANRKAQGYISTDWVKIAEAQANNGAALNCSQEIYEAFWRPFFGDQAKAMDKYRAGVLLQAGNREAQIAHFQYCKKNGIALDGFQIMDNSTIVDIWANATGEKLDPTDKKDFQKIVAIRTYLGSQAQEEGLTDENGNPKPFNKTQATIRVQNALRAKVRGQGLSPAFIPVDELGNRGRSDSFQVLKTLTRMWGNSHPQWENYEPSKQDMQEVLTKLTMGDAIQINGLTKDVISFAEVGKRTDPNKVYLDKDVFEEAKRDVMAMSDTNQNATWSKNVGGNVSVEPNLFFVLGRYFQILKEGRELGENKYDLEP